jgi:Skp family chaperone for outer membrane proteins
MKNQTFSLAFAPDITRENDIPTQFTGIAYSGGLIPGYGWLGDVAIDLASLQVPTKPVFALLNHDVDQRCGKCTVTNTGNTIEVLGSFSQSTDAGKQVAAEFSEDAPWEFSVGINAQIEQFREPKTIDLNGQTLTVNAVFRNAKVREVSFVPAGADPHTQAIAFEQQPELFSSTVPEVPVELKDVQAKLDSVNQLNADLQVKLSALQDEHQAKVADLNTQLANEAKAHQAALNRAAELESELKAFHAAVRKQSVEALFTDLHREVTDEAIKPYLAMDDATFAAVSADLRALQPKGNPALFTEFAVNGATMNSVSEADLCAKLFNQVAGAN